MIYWTVMFTVSSMMRSYRLRMILCIILNC